MQQQQQQQQKTSAFGQPDVVLFIAWTDTRHGTDTTCHQPTNVAYVWRPPPLLADVTLPLRPTLPGNQNYGRSRVPTAIHVAVLVQRKLVCRVFYGSCVQEQVRVVYVFIIYTTLFISLLYVRMILLRVLCVFITAQCTLGLMQMRGLGIACRPSVRPSVCDVGDL